MPTSLWTVVAKARAARGDEKGAAQARRNAKANAASNAVEASINRRTKEYKQGDLFRRGSQDNRP